MCTTYQPCTDEHCLKGNRQLLECKKNQSDLCNPPQRVLPNSDSEGQYLLDELMGVDADELGAKEHTHSNAE